MSEYQESFRAEAQELLAHLEDGLLELEEQPGNRDLVEPVFRSLHTIKGNCKFLGFKDVGDFAHEIEAAFEFVRKGQMSYTREFGKLALAAKDLLRTMIESHYGEEPVDAAKVTEVLSVLKVMEEEQTTTRKDEAKKKIHAACDSIHALAPLLKEAADNFSLINDIVNAFNSLREGAGVLGTDLAMFAEKFQYAFKSLFDKKLPAPRELTQLTIEAIEYYPIMVVNSEVDLTSPDMDPMVLIESMEKPILIFEMLEKVGKEHALTLEAPRTAPVPGAGGSDKAAAPKPAKEFTYRVTFKPSETFIQTGLHLSDMEKELANLGPVTRVTKIEPEEAAGGKTPFLEALVTTKTSSGTVKEIFQFTENTGELKVTVVDKGEGLDPRNPEPKLGQILIERGDLTPEQLETSLEKQRQQDTAVAAGVDWNKLPTDPPKPKPEKKDPKGKDGESFSFMRVSLKRLTELVNLIGELVAQKARLLQRAQTLGNNELVSVAEELNRVIEKLRDGTMINRMKPIGETFQKFERMAKELGKELKKEINLLTEGVETELDMATLEKLNDPLIHMLRNTIDHGIENPEIRKQVGKPTTGNVKFSATHSGSMVVISITDDGAGLNEERIVAKAVEKGLIKPDARLTKDEIYNLIFLPGFSTAAVVTSVSGRGTGMDVVKRAIDSLHGKIEIKSEKGKGSTFTLKLPLSLAIMEGLLVQVGQRHFIFPLTLVEEIVHLVNSEQNINEKRNIKNVRGHIVPFIRLRERFNEDKLLGGEIEQMVICNIDGKRIGFIVDEVVGEHHTLVKNLGSFYKDAVLFSGVTILGDGTLAFILDMTQLLHAGDIPELETAQVM